VRRLVSLLAFLLLIGPPVLGWGGTGEQNPCLLVDLYRLAGIRSSWVPGMGVWHLSVTDQGDILVMGTNVTESGKTWTKIFRLSSHGRAKWFYSSRLGYVADPFASSRDGSVVAFLLHKQSPYDLPHRYFLGVMDGENGKWIINWNISEVDNPPTCIAISPGRRYVIAGSGQAGDLVLWVADLSSNETSTLSWHGVMDSLKAIFAYDDGTVLCCGDAKIVAVGTDGAKRWEVEKPSTHYGYAFSADGEYLVDMRSGTTNVFRVEETGLSELREIREYPVGPAGFSGRRVLLAVSASSLICWDPAVEPQPQHELAGAYLAWRRDDFANLVALGGDISGSRLFVSDAAAFHVVEMETGRDSWSYRTGGGSTGLAAISSDGTYAAGTYDHNRYLVLFRADRPLTIGHVRVSVSDSMTGEPLRGTSVAVGAKQSQTGPEGEVTISVAPGSYTVRVSAEGYVETSKEATVEPGDVTSLHFRLERGAQPKPPTQPSLTCTVSAAQVTAEVDEVEISGALSPAAAQVQISIVVTRPDGSVEEESVQTDQYGCYRWSLIPSSPGRWKVKAVWRGSQELLPAESDEVTFDALENPSSSIELTPSERQVPLGSPLILRGMLIPRRGGLEISLAYKRPDGSTLTRSVSTGDDGSFQDVLTPDAAGRWSVTATWQGDQEHFSATSGTIFWVLEAQVGEFSLAGILGLLVLAYVVYDRLSRAG